ncbi:DEAD-box ATP-dependent RNA helicase 5 isoform X1 [Magnolia sinica]|uniref:DEAD-box ATP-dependent RNA helicase 5 isoform X1 n=1 Tax=Magnolia sinica TaxID=86752 RepID=UPI002659A3F5|nr:DEAD-box ATP-dependent RNA helicase 5 isoform X1 [Magnolia sinica]
MGRKLEENLNFGETESLGIAMEKEDDEIYGIKADEMKKEKRKKKKIKGEEENQNLDFSESKKKKKKKLEESQTIEIPEKKKKKRSKAEGSSEEGNGALEILEEKEKKKKKKKGSGDGNSLENGEQKHGKEREEFEANGAVVSGNDTKESRYAALTSFVESGLPDEVLECCKNFRRPSPIQSHAWPFLLDGRDFIGIAATGSGKTLAFGVPALMHILRKENRKTSKRAVPLCLVLSPTRELAQQIADVLCDAGKPCGLKSVCLYGGTSKGPQISALKSGVDIVIGTPGRLKDLIEMGICCLKEVSFVVLDEADRMLDMGFEQEVRSILSQTSSARQMVMFSATWPLAVHQLAQEFMDPNPVKVVVGSEDLAANHDVMQIVEVLEDRARNDRLVALLEKYHNSQRNRVLVFVLYKKEAARVETMLQKKGWKVVSVHGDKAQHDRTKALSLFKEGKCPLMIATDVASRGLDIPDVEVVINYSFPLTAEDYVHRIGRTGRAGKKGVAHTFFMQENKGLAGELVNVLREAGQIVPASLMKFGTHVKKKESKLYGAHFKEIAADAPKSTKITFNNSDDED